MSRIGRSTKSFQVRASKSKGRWQESGWRARGDRRAGGGIAKLASRRSKVVKSPDPFDAPRERWTKMPQTCNRINFYHKSNLVIVRDLKRYLGRQGTPFLPPPFLKGKIRCWTLKKCGICYNTLKKCVFVQTHQNFVVISSWTLSPLL